MKLHIVASAAALIVAWPVFSARASAWPASIFDGASPQILAEIQAHQDLVKEAEGYLSPCTGTDADTHLACLSSQYNFVLDYIYAVYNEYTSQQNVGFLLSGDGNPPSLGITPDPVLGCAWRITVIAAGSAGLDNPSLDEYKTDCLRLSDEAQQQANTIAMGVLLPKIDAHLQKGNRPFDVFTGN
jgi:hypothetical protein